MSADYQERVTDLIEQVLDLLDPLLGPDLAVSTELTDEGTVVTIHTVVGLRDEGSDGDG